jgi:hypothetical protein
VEVIKDWWSWYVNFQNTITLLPGTTLNIAAGGVDYGPNGIDFGPENGTATLVNDGAIIMNGQQCYLGGYCHLVLQGAGSLTMQGDVDNYFQCYDVTLQPPQVLHGCGTIQPEIINNSTIIANNGILSLYLVSGNGTVSVTDGTLKVGGGLHAGDLTMGPAAALIVQDYVIMVLSRNFSFAQANPASWSWGYKTDLQMSGQGFPQTLEVGGQDRGASDTGLSNNFALPSLYISASGTQVKLVDLIDNGHWPSREALYVNELWVELGTVLNLNGLKLYTVLDGNMHRVRAGEGSRFGGGKIIDNGGFPPAVDLMLFD